MREPLRRLSARARAMKDAALLRAAAAASGLSVVGDHHPRDVFVVGFPKSGNTWMQHLMASLLYGLDGRQAPDALVQLLAPDVHAAKLYKRVGPAMCFKSHDLPRPEHKRVIYLVRDGRDALVSYWRMNQALGLAVSLDDMVLRSEGLFPCSWDEHVRRWDENPYGATILPLRYEDLLADTVGQLERVCAFLEIERSRERLAAVQEGSSFDAMRAKERTFGWGNASWPTDASFVRRGQAGSHKDEMPAALAERFSARARAELERWGYEP